MYFRKTGFSFSLRREPVRGDVTLQATEAEVAGVLQRYGDLQSLSRHPGPHAGHPASFVVEYCNVQVSSSSRRSDGFTMKRKFSRASAPMFSELYAAVRVGL